MLGTYIWNPNKRRDYNLHSAITTASLLWLIAIIKKWNEHDCSAKPCEKSNREATVLEDSGWATIALSTGCFSLDALANLLRNPIRDEARLKSRVTTKTCWLYSIIPRKLLAAAPRITSPFANRIHMQKCLEKCGSKKSATTTRTSPPPVQTCSGGLQRI